MRLSTSGIAFGFEEPVVGAICTSPDSFSGVEPSHRIFLGPLSDAPEKASVRAVITQDPPEKLLGGRLKTGPAIYSVRHVDHLKDGDVVAMSPKDGFVRTIYRPDSAHNTVFITERCNSNCLMCSQPPKDVDDTDYLFGVNMQLLNFIDPGTTNLTITGGEPTLLGDRLFQLISQMKARLPSTHLHMLTNGRSFAWKSVTRALAAVEHPRLSLGIPLYSDYATDHDYIVQAEGAFDQTVLGLHQLARWGIAVEIRVVLHKLTIPRLTKLAEFITRNFPFVTHVALMGLEPTGYTPRNRELLWVDPVNYQEDLQTAVELLEYAGLNISIYNSQLCLTRPELWKFARRSISDWKNIYLQECSKCAELTRCGGLFLSAERLHSTNIKPFNNPVSLPSRSPL